jgi:hypothetical protein
LFFSHCLPQTRYNHPRHWAIGPLDLKAVVSVDSNGVVAQRNTGSWLGTYQDNGQNPSGSAQRAPSSLLSTVSCSIKVSLSIRLLEELKFGMAQR